MNRYSNGLSTPFTLWLSSVTFALRDLRASIPQTLVSILVLAITVSAVHSMRTVEQAVQSLLHDGPRAWLGADLVVETAEGITSQQRDAIRGLEYAVSYEALTMVTAESAADDLLVSIRAIDPARYAFYGQLDVDPPLPVPAALQPHSAIISEDTADLLHARVGTRLLMGGTGLSVAGILHAESDRFASARNVYPRVVVSLAAFESLALARPGTRVRARILFRLPAGTSLDEFSARLQRIFPNAFLFDYRKLDDRLVRSLELLDKSLLLVGWSVLALGALGCALLTLTHLERRWDSIAVLKTLGAGNRFIVSAYLFEVAAMATLASLLGLAGSRSGYTPSRRTGCRMHCWSPARCAWVAAG